MYLDTIIQHTGHTAETFSTYKKFFRQLIETTLESDDTIIGGEGIIIQIDESKFGKRKYNRGRYINYGHRVEGSWALVGVERTSERRVFAEVLEDRKESKIIEVIQRYVAEISIIWTDYLVAIEICQEFSM
jgi:hypothetical protein